MSKFVTKTLFILELDYLVYAKYFYLIYLVPPVYPHVINALVLANSFCQHP